MKKLLMGLVAIVATCVAQAASVNWHNTGFRTAGTIYNTTGTAIGSGAVAYLFDAGVTTQQAVLDAVLAGTALSDASLKSVDNATTASSKIAPTTAITYGEAGTYVSMFYAILDTTNNKLLLTDSLEKALQTSDTTTYAFSGSETWSKNNVDGKTFTGAGWYATSSETVPEPTSGLLLLVGMGALALRRKRA